jgi:hypothetical protein
MDELKKRPCFGRNANLGSLYSFQNEHLYPDISVFERKLPDEFQSENKITDSDGKKVAITFENTTSKKLSLLNIETDVKLSVLCGMITSNEINFMKHKELQNRGMCFYAHTSETSFQSFDVNDKNLQNLCKTIESEKADHVIVGITYGNQIIVKLTFDNIAKEIDDKELQEKVGKDFDNLLQLNDIGGIENYDQWFTYLPNLKFEVYSDLLNAESKTVEDFCNTFQQIKTDCKKTENVKQLYFHLMPISTFQEKTGKPNFRITFHIFLKKNCILVKIYFFLFSNVEENVLFAINVPFKRPIKSKNCLGLTWTSNVILLKKRIFYCYQK